LFRRVQALLRHNRNSGGKYIRNKYGALLKGLVRCTACGCAMSHHFTTNGNKRYRYYVCINAQKRGWDKCPSPSLPAAELEQFVVDQIRVLGQDGQVITDSIREAQR
jgi:site-specific DNA recombinase